jgi:hypothetical protein
MECYCLRPFSVEPGIRAMVMLAFIANGKTLSSPDVMEKLKNTINFLRNARRQSPFRIA